MKYSVKYKKVYDKDDQIVDISDVKKENKQSEYYSIGSHTPMTAVLGENNQHHFRAKRGYMLNPETELHDYVKRILKYRFDTEESFFIKYFRIDCCSHGKDCIFYNERINECGCLDGKIWDYDLKKYYDTAIVEGSYDGFVADVLLTSSTHPNRRPVFLEVVVTHQCSKEKIASGNKIVEIFVREEKDAYCELKESTSDIYYEDDIEVKFHNFDKETIISDCPHFAKEKHYSKQPYTFAQKPIPTKFYCEPQQVTEAPIQAYYNNTKIGMLFASNMFGKPFIFDRALSLNGRRFVMMGKDIYDAVKPWVVYSVSWNGKEYRYWVRAHFDYYSALRDFTEYQGKEWLGGDTLSDLC